MAAEIVAQGRRAQLVAEVARPRIRDEAMVKRLLFGSQFPVVVVDAIWGYAFHLLLAEMTTLQMRVVHEYDPGGPEVTAYNFVYVKAVAEWNLPAGTTVGRYHAAIGFRWFINLGPPEPAKIPVTGLIRRVPGHNGFPDEWWHRDWDEFDGCETVAILCRDLRF